MDLADRSIYGFSTVEHLRFADVDANGHVNNGSFIEMMENARVSYLRQIVRSADHPALLSVRVESLAACETLLRKNGVRVLKPDAGRLLVPPSEAAHLTIEFVQ